MVSPLPFPDWVPWWVHVAVLVTLGTFALLFLLMPFSVLGTKTRLESIEIRLDEIQGEIRSLTLRLSATGDAQSHNTQTGYFEPPPPIPPPSSRAQTVRTEPRLY